MKPGMVSLGTVFAPTNSYWIPRYQRKYEWGPAQWQGLARDVTLLEGGKEGASPHFLGILLLAAREAAPVGPSAVGHGEFDVIDGQQRLVTIAVWTAAISDHAKAHGKTAKKGKIAKLEVGTLDKPGYLDAISGKWEERVAARLTPGGPLAAYHYFRWLLWMGKTALEAAEPLPAPDPAKSRWWDTDDHGDLFQEFLARQKAKNLEFIDQSATPDPSRLMNGTFQQLEILELNWDDRTDEPQAVIFEALNGMRVELKQLDHVRNRIFLPLAPADADKAYRDSWAPTEDRLLRTSHRGLRADPGSQFLYDFLISEGEDDVNRSRAAAQFDRFSRRLKLKGKVQLIEDVLVPAMESWIAVVTGADVVHLPKAPDRILPPEAVARIRSVRAFSISSDPLILKLVGLWARSAIPDAELTKCLSTLDSFWARHMLAGTNLSPYRSKFMGYMRTIAAVVSKSGTISSSDVSKTLKPDAPSDGDILGGIASLELYRRLRATQIMSLLRGIETGSTSGGAHPLPGGKLDSEFTVEHIAPQSLTNWRTDLAAWRINVQDVEKVNHALGNLTAATNKHNKSVGSKRLLAKQKRLNIEPKLWLNDGWATKKRWADKDIILRSRAMARRALEYWKDL